MQVPALQHPRQAAAFAALPARIGCLQARLAIDNYRDGWLARMFAIEYAALFEAVIDDVLAANADKVAEYRGGKDKLFGFFVGQTMKAMQGKGNPAVVNQLLKEKLDG